MPEKVSEEARCPNCGGLEIEVVDIKVGLMGSLPSILYIECARCGYDGEGYTSAEGWNVKWRGQKEYA